MLRISELFIYPIKSLGGIALSSAVVTDRGLQYDRRWMLVDDNNNFMTQRELAGLALFSVSVAADGLVVQHPGQGKALRVPFTPAESGEIVVQVWEDSCRARPVSKEADRWFSEALSSSCRLVYMPDATERKVDPQYAKGGEITSFSDAYPLLMIGQSSLDDLNSRLEVPVPINRFRPNLVFTGGAPFEEDVLEAFVINGIRFYGVKPCARCVVTTIDQQLALQGKEPLQTLSAFRKKANKIYFGQNLVHRGGGTLHVGDAIEVVQKGAKPLFA